MGLKNFCRLLPAALFLALLSAQSSGYLAVSDPQKVVGKRGEAVQVKIPVTVKTGYHVNSNTPSEEYLIPLKLTWTSTGALEGGTVEYPNAAMQKFEFSDKPISVYMGSFDLTAKFTVGAKAAAGPGSAVGKLKYQACSDRACFPPKTVDVTIPYQVQ